MDFYCNIYVSTIFKNGFQEFLKQQIYIKKSSSGKYFKRANHFSQDIHLYETVEFFSVKDAVWSLN